MGEVFTNLDEGLADLIIVQSPRPNFECGKKSETQVKERVSMKASLPCSRPRSQSCLSVEPLESRQLLDSMPLAISPTALSLPVMANTQTVREAPFLSSADGIMHSGSVHAQTVARPHDRSAGLEVRLGSMGHAHGDLGREVHSGGTWIDTRWSQWWTPSIARAPGGERFGRIPDSSGYLRSPASGEADGVFGGTIRNLEVSFVVVRVIVVFHVGGTQGGKEKPSPTAPAPGPQASVAADGPAADASTVVPNAANLLDGLEQPSLPAAAVDASILLASRGDSDLPQLPVVDDPTAENPPPGLSAQIVANASRDAVFRAGLDNFVFALPTLLPPVGSRPEPEQPAEERRTVSPGLRETAGFESLPSPEAAGLLTNESSFGLTALEHAIRSLTDPESGADGGGSGLWKAFGLSCWLLGSALAYMAARRVRSPAALALPRTGLPVDSKLPREELS